MSGCAARSGSQLLDVAEHPVVGTGLDVDEAVSFVEATGVRIDLVDVDVDLPTIALTYQPNRRLQQGGADALVAQRGSNVQLLELGQGAVVVRRGPQRQEGEARGVLVIPGQQNDDVVALEQPSEPGAEFL